MNKFNFIFARNSRKFQRMNMTVSPGGDPPMTSSKMTYMHNFLSHFAPEILGGSFQMNKFSLYKVINSIVVYLMVGSPQEAKPV